MDNRTRMTQIGILAMKVGIENQVKGKRPKTKNPRISINIAEL
ncbi:MAG: hypothetical protein ACXW03_11085 [Methylobacter sp.]